ncbi:hypothetical protein GQX73_g8522 [Xylaria multiplex]|uniref:AAA+ ATPase domain-containing protein n=1 Tax=Xylaria multiplex TaxID=323545 RepID=A0A7C8IRZ2_9PEZI|nr:hypothetical protein GQX73_g8522 [Xylaria multiplex]
MSNQWTRAFRPVAQARRQARLVSRPTRSFHSTIPSRAAGDTPQDDGRKPGSDETRRDGTEGTQENLLGENTAVTDGGNQGRKKPTNGLRSRALRNRKSDLPPVKIPEPFLGIAVYRHGETKTLLKVDSAEQNRYSTSEDTDADALDPLLFRQRVNALFNASAWSNSDVEETIKLLKSTKSEPDRIMRRLDMLGASSYWAVLHQIKTQHGDDAGSKPETLELTPPPESLGWVTALLKHNTGNQNVPVIFEEEFASLLLAHVMKGGEIPLTKVALYEPTMVDEIVTALRAEFLIRAPEGSRLANLCRPATIINVHDCSGFSVAQDTLQHAAEILGANVLHLRAHDIAHILGRYIGQDITRSPGDISLLGYRAAENCGRLKPPHPSIEEENEEIGTLELPLTVTLRDEKGRKDTKRQTVSMDEYLLNSGTRGKSDELWEDIKVNAALDELIHLADVDTAEQKPLIVHIDDFNGLNMDDTGATIVSKIRKVVDELWLSGRKVVLVGSCSTHNAPKSYQKAIRDLEMSERVIHLYQHQSSDPWVRASTRSALALWRGQDYLRENDENIVRMLWSMTGLDDSMPTHSKMRLGLDKSLHSKEILEMLTPAQHELEMPTPAQHELELDMLSPFANYWRSILPMTNIYRIATTMVSLSSTGATELFSRACFEKALSTTVAVDVIRAKAAARSKTSINAKKDAKGDMLAGMRKLDPFGENQEEKLMSGMVNAQDIRTTFKDIHAPRETIESIKMLTTLSLVRPEAFSYGVLASDRIPGCLLYGPPGTGKTLLAKAVAKESGANMIEVSGASINNMYVGESEKNVRALFRLAKKKEPMVIFIDEADALLGARGGHQNANRRETINQFLREWDGMDKMKAFIMVATNRPFDLDEAVLRRLPRKLLIDLPLEADRASILKIHLKDEVVDETVSIEDMAKRTPLYSGSDLKNVCVAAAMAAVKEELEASERHTGPEPYEWAEKRILNHRHFDKALKEIGASVSEDMATLTAIKKFDERYGDNKARKKRKGMGFEVIPEAHDSEQARVRSGR